MSPIQVHAANSFASDVNWPDFAIDVVDEGDGNDQECDDPHVLRHLRRKDSKSRLYSLCTRKQSYLFIDTHSAAVSSTAVEYLPHDQVILGSYPAVSYAYSFFLYLLVVYY